MISPYPLYACLSSPLQNGKNYSPTTMTTDLCGDAYYHSLPGRFGRVMSDIDDFKIEMRELRVSLLGQNDLVPCPTFTPNQTMLLTFQQGSHHLLKQQEILETSPTFTTRTNSWLVFIVSENSNV